MPVSKSRKKKYSPTRILQKRLIAETRKNPIDQSSILQLNLTNNAALDLINKDIGSLEDFTILQGAFQVALVTSKMFYLGALEKEIQAALDTATSYAEKAQDSTEQWVYTAEYKAEASFALQVHEEQLKLMVNEDLSKILKTLNSITKHKDKHV